MATIIREIKFTSVKHPPKTDKPILIRFADGTIAGAFYEGGGFFPVEVYSTYDGAGDCVFFDTDTIVEWAGY